MPTPTSKPQLKIPPKPAVKSPTKTSGKDLKPLTKAEVKAARRKARPRWKTWLLRIGVTCLVLFALGVIAGVGLFAWFAKDLPSIDQLENRVLTESTKIYDRTGTHLLYETGKDVRRTYTKIDAISPDMRNATVALEDKNFYTHHGFDPVAILRSAGIDLSSSREVGGSTITQQFVKLAIVGSERNLSRKIKEAILAVELEQKYSKDQILEFYLNEISYGGINLGVAAAAQSYYGTTPDKLTLAQSTFLAAIPQKPSRINSDMPGLLARKDFALDQMVKNGYITQDQADAAKQEDVTPQKNRSQKDAPHFVDYVVSQLENDYGSNFIDQGLKVTTTLDYDKQQIAEQVVSDGMANVEKFGGSNAALVSLDAKTGQILAMVGSKDYYATDYDGQYNVATHPRQPGSSFKPIVYMTAFANGYNPNTIIFDVETDFPQGSGLKPYHPHNFDGEGTFGPITMKTALAHSLNIPAVKTLYLAGENKVLDSTDALGYTTLGDRSQYGLSLALGSGGVKLLEHTSTFATFAREGERHPTSSILKVEDRNGDTLYDWQDSPSQVVDKTAVQELNSVLSDSAARGSVFRGLNISGKTIAAKTGTTNDFKDAWTMMYTPSFATGVWTGNNDDTDMHYLADGIYLAAPIANAYMSKILADLPDEKFNAPPAVKANKPVLQGQIGEEVEKYVDIGTQHIIPDSCTDTYPAAFKEQKTFKEVHTILYYLRKDDPLGAPPANPADDPMYQSWEDAVQLWASGQPDYISTKTQYEDCNLHAANQTPTVSITFPTTGAKLTSKTFAVETKINPGTNRSIKKIDYLVDGHLVDTQTSQPFTTDYTASTLTTGNHTLTVRVTNDRDNTTETSVNFSYSPGTTTNTNTTNVNSNGNSNSNTNKKNTNTSVGR